jgi:hypothetical protein
VIEGDSPLVSIIRRSTDLLNAPISSNLYQISFSPFRCMIKVAINGYGTIGKRVADAVAAQKDMKVVVVSKTRPSA